MVKKQETESFDKLFDKFKRLHGRMKPDSSTGAGNIAGGKLAAERGEAFVIRKSFKYGGYVWQVGEKVEPDDVKARFSFLCERGFIVPEKSYLENELHRRFEKMQRDELLPFSQRLNAMRSEHTRAQERLKEAEVELGAAQIFEKLTRTALEKGEAEGVELVKSILSELDPKTAPDLALTEA